MPAYVGRIQLLEGKAKVVAANIITVT